LLLPGTPPGVWFGGELASAWRVQFKKAAPSGASATPASSTGQWVTTTTRADGWAWPASSATLSPVYTFTLGSVGTTLVMTGQLGVEGVLEIATDTGGFYTAPGAAANSTATLYVRNTTTGGATIRADGSDDLATVALPLWAVCAMPPPLPRVCASTDGWSAVISATAYVPRAAAVLGPTSVPERVRVASEARVIRLPAALTPPPAAAPAACTGGWAYPPLAVPSPSPSRQPSRSSSSSLVPPSQTRSRKPRAVR
jgi:hypothetical protein